MAAKGFTAADLNEDFFAKIAASAGIISLDSYTEARGGGGALGYLGGRIRSLSKLKNTPKALISGQKSTLILIKR